MTKFLLQSIIFCLLGGLSAYAGAYAQERSPPSQDIEKHVFFMTFRGGDIEKDGKRVGVGSLKELELSKFDPEAPTKIYIHGYKRKYNVGAGVILLRAYFRSNRYKKKPNVVLVDWSKFSGAFNFPRGGTLERMGLPYLGSVKRAKGVGEYVGKFVQFLVAQGGAKWEDMHLIGHSLGAQIAGSAGRATGGKIARITALDPAAPCYETFLFICNFRSETIGPSNAQFVDVIHTGAKFFGMRRPVGHVDFYPNGGLKMPGCRDTHIHIFPSITEGSCSHSKATEYMEESILDDDALDFVAHNCGSYALFKKGDCATHAVASMGEGSDLKSVKGKYFLETNKNPPYAQGKRIFVDSRESEESGDDYEESEGSDDYYEESEDSDEYYEDYIYNKRK